MYTSSESNNIKLFIHIRDFLEIFMLIIIMLRMSSMYLVINPFYDSQINELCYNWLVNILGSLIVLSIILEKIKCSLLQIVVAGISYIYFFDYSNMVNYNTSEFNKEFVKIFFLMFFYFVINNKRPMFEIVWKRYSTIVLVMASVSLFFYFFGEIVHVIPHMDLKYYNYNSWLPGSNYFYLYFVNYSQNRPFLGINVVRNIGMFMEAPGFALPLSFALWWELFGCENIKKHRVSVIVITMLTTFSMKAYLMLVLLVFLYFWKNCKQMGWEYFREIIGYTFIGIVALLVLYIVFIDHKVFFKMGSIAWRMQDTIAAFLTWLDYPIWGCGYSNQKEMFAHFLDPAHAGYTAGLFNVMAYGGVLMLGFYLISLLGYFNVSKNNKWRAFVFVVMFVTFLFMTSMQFRYFTIFILAEGLAMLASPYMSDNKKTTKYKRLKYKVKGSVCI
ncbi:MAG: hypothetical protein PUG10_03960 [Lachnospiraceae bacterium]|nr:hypothetical protein [Lachnospiraceae bacterium]